MPDLDEMFFPEAISSINLANGESYDGGIVFPAGAMAGNYFKFKTINYINIGDYFTAAEIGVAGIEKYATVAKFLNNYSVKLQLSFADPYTLNLQSCLFDETDTLVTLLSNQQIYDEYNFINCYEEYYIYCFFTTHYQTAVEGVSNPDTAGFYGFGFWRQPNNYKHPYIYDGSEVTSLDLIEKFKEDMHVQNTQFNLQALYTFTSMDDFVEWLKNNGDPFDEPVFPQDPPAGSDDTSTTGGGRGNYDKTSDPIDFPDLPTGGALTSGMIKGYVMSSQEIIAFQDKLWNMSAFDIATQFQKLVSDPLQCIISFGAIPLAPTISNTPEHVKLGSFDTEANGYKITNQYAVLDMGELDVKEFWGSALDYAPFTDLEIYLPFCGIQNIRIEDVQNSKIHVKYYVDVLTGSLTAFVKCGQSVLYSFTGNCLQHIPVTSQSSDLLKNNIGAVGAVGIGLATGNAAAAIAGAAYGAINTASSKNHVQRAGDLAGSAGVLGEYVPYIIMHRPVQSLARNYNKYKGYPCNISMQLGSLKGYTEVEHINLSVQGATDAELLEIEALLKEGVII